MLMQLIPELEACSTKKNKINNIMTVKAHLTILINKYELSILDHFECCENLAFEQVNG